MKKLTFILALLALLAGCSKYKHENFSEYKGRPASQIFQNGETNLAKKNYGKAVKDFQALDALYPFSKYSQQGQLDIIYAYYKDGKDAQGIAAADRYIRLYPRGKGTDYALYLKGLIYFNEGGTWLEKLAGSDPAERNTASKQQAFMAFSELVQGFPNSPYRHDAILRMQYIRNLFARKDLQIAQFYFRHQAYAAAANRAAAVVEHYNGTPAVEKSLVLMVKSYRILGLQDLANNTLKILQSSFPNSKNLAKLNRTA